MLLIPYSYPVSYRPNNVKNCLEVAPRKYWSLTFPTPTNFTALLEGFLPNAVRSLVKFVLFSGNWFITIEGLLISDLRLILEFVLLLHSSL